MSQGYPQYPPQYPPQYQPPTVIIAGGQSQALPALVNLLCFPGMGQLIQGRLIMAIVWWVLHLLAAASVLIGIGICLWPIVWIACVIDAARYDPTSEMLQGSQQSSGVLLVAGIIAFILIAPVFGMVLMSIVNARAQLAAGNGGQNPLPPAPAPSNPKNTNSEAGTKLNSNNDDVKTPEMPPVEPTQPVPTVSPDPPSDPVPAPVPAAPVVEPKPALSAIESAKMNLRIWKDLTGQFQVNARFVSYSNGTVRIAKESGGTIDIPLEKLSREDQEFIRSLR